MEVGAHEEDAVSHPSARSPPFLWSFGLVLLFSVTSVARMVVGLDRGCCQTDGRAATLCFGLCFWALLRGKERVMDLFFVLLHTETCLKQAEKSS